MFRRIVLTLALTVSFACGGDTTRSEEDVDSRLSRAGAAQPQEQVPPAAGHSSDEENVDAVVALAPEGGSDDEQRGTAVESPSSAPVPDEADQVDSKVAVADAVKEPPVADQRKASKKAGTKAKTEAKPEPEPEPEPAPAPEPAPEPKPAPAPKPAPPAETKGSITGSVSAKPSKYNASVIVHLVNAPKSRGTGVKTMNQKGMKFTPHVLPVVAGTTVKFLNEDEVRHNVFTPDGDKYDLGTWPKGEVRKHRFSKAGVYRQLCNVHPEMSAVVLVLDNRYFDKTDSAGRFEIKGIPEGTYKIRAWGEKLTPVTKTITVSAGKASKIDFDLRKK